ncbi:hypothetical protein BOTBODRAFT_149180 [Botryobasidium botryosum FD-172 SS1]|uniref:CFEM domain-containing protein n=1 Tax=Botryobasidium botryosum (strain FD-172 SS1) TaxID=930990 RepID=A0A067LVU2_BOTB1|nr:hypothetical protein BOTBODRAFT_149180 [Botryobasidium botryosum FD-172 SS1]
MRSLAFFFVLFSSAMISGANQAARTNHPRGCIGARTSGSDCYATTLQPYWDTGVQTLDWHALCTNQTFVNTINQCFNDACGTGSSDASTGLTSINEKCAGANTGSTTATPTTTTTTTTQSVITTTFANGTVTTVPAGAVISASNSLTSLTASVNGSLASATSSLQSVINSAISHISQQSTSATGSLGSHTATQTSNSAHAPELSLPICALLTSVLGIALGAILV